MVEKRFIHEIIFCALLIMSFQSLCYAQRDTIYSIDTDFESIIRAKAKDSIFNDLKNKQLHLFGEAELYFEDVTMKASYLLVDFNKKEVLASYTYDKDSNRIGLPIFTDGSEEIEAAKIRFNFDTKKGYILEMKVKQDENFLYMEVAKRQANEEVHFKKGRFTHCDLEEPHYHFQLSKAILIPQKRIVSGPMNLWIKGVPTPLGLPFIFIPQKKQNQHNHGIIFPQFAIQSPYGMGFQNLGYYIPINDSLQTTVYANLYSRGSWGLSNSTDYKIRYKFDGNLNVGYQLFKAGFPDDGSQRKLTVRWTHRQSEKANPFWNFNASVNFNSDNATKTSLEVLNKDYFNNSTNSDININRLFPGKPYTAGIKISARQNSLSKNIALTSPFASFNVSRFSPFARRKGAVGSKKWYEQIGMTYNIEGQNRNTFSDSLLKNQRLDLFKNTLLNGFSQNTTIQTAVGLFKNTWKLNPSLTYGNKINFQQIRKKYDAASNSTVVDTLRQAGMSQSLSFNAQLTTVVYSYYRFVGKNKPLLRHVLTPSFGLRYTPGLNKLITDSVGVNKAPVTYSAFERSLYTESAGKTSSVLSFGFNNTFELKTKSAKDTLTGFRKTRIIDALSISGTYDFMKDSMKLSDINTSLRINPVNFINLLANANFSPYDWNDSTNQKKKEFAIDTRGQLVRMLNFSLSTTLVFTSKEGRKKLNENKDLFNSNWNADFQYFAQHPDRYIDFSIPWKMSVSHIYELNRSDKPKILGRQFNQVNTVQISMDVSLTKRWKVIWNMYGDIQSQRVINAKFSMVRDMHCWNLSLDWTPIGLNKNFLLRINSTSNLFKDAKIELKKPPVIF